MINHLEFRVYENFPVSQYFILRAHFDWLTLNGMDWF